MREHRGVCVACLAIMVVMLLARPTIGGQLGNVRLHSAVTVGDDQVLLRDVARLEGEVARSLGRIPVSQFKPGQKLVVVRLEVLRKKLTDHGVNWSNVALSGYLRCRVRRVEAAVNPVMVMAQEHAKPQAAGAAPSEQSGGAFKLRELLVQRIERAGRGPREQLVITFNKRHRKLLAMSVLDDRWEVEPLTNATLGRLLFAVRRWRDERIIHTYHISATVARKMRVVVLTRSLRRGQTISSRDVTMKQVLIKSNRHTPATALSEVVGQRCTTVLRPGAVVYARHIEPPVLVKRGQMLYVRCLVGGLVIRQEARATENGAQGQLITVHNKDSTQDMLVRVTGPGQATLELGSHAVASHTTTHAAGNGNGADL